MKARIYNLIILDESGSMHPVRRQAVSGLNETIQTIQQAQRNFSEQEHLISIVSFNTNGTRTLADCQAADTVQPLAETSYSPAACTPLYDAMGTALTHLREEMHGEGAALVTIITDGYENASEEYNAKSIKSLVDELTAKDWVFTYIGANQDVTSVAKELGVSHSMEFTNDEEGTSEMFRESSRSSYRFMQRVHDEMKCCLDTPLCDADFQEEFNKRMSKNSKEGYFEK